MKGRSTQLLLPFLFSLFTTSFATPATGSSGLRSLARPERRDEGGSEGGEVDAFCVREIVDATDETEGVVFRTIISAEVASVAAADAVKMATGEVKLLMGQCSDYCSDDDATFDMNRVREMCGPTAYDCSIDWDGSGSCWMAIDAEEEYDEDVAAAGGDSSGENGDSAGSYEEDGMAAGKVEWNEDTREYDVEVENGYDQGDAVVYDQETGSIVTAPEQEEQEQEQTIVVVPKEEMTVVAEQAAEETVTIVEKVPVEEEEEQPNCISCHYFDRVRWVAAGKPPRAESFYDKTTNDPNNPDKCLEKGHWFGVISGKLCDEVFGTEQKYEICGQYPHGGKCQPVPEWDAEVNSNGKLYGNCVYLCDNGNQGSGEPEDADQR